MPGNAAGSATPMGIPVRYDPLVFIKIFLGGGGGVGRESGLAVQLLMIAPGFLRHRGVGVGLGWVGLSRLEKCDGPV